MSTSYELDQRRHISLMQLFKPDNTEELDSFLKRSSRLSVDIYRHTPAPKVPAHLTLGDYVDKAITSSYQQHIAIGHEIPDGEQGEYRRVRRKALRELAVVDQSYHHHFLIAASVEPDKGSILDLWLIETGTPFSDPGDLPTSGNVMSAGADSYLAFSGHILTPSDELESYLRKHLTYREGGIALNDGVSETEFATEVFRTLYPPEKVVVALSKIENCA